MRLFAYNTFAPPALLTLTLSDQMIGEGMSSKKSFLLALSCGLMAITDVAQNRGVKKSDCRQEDGEVERKDDRFTNEATVTLKPQVITTATPGQQLKMALTYRIKPEARGREQSIIPEMVTVTFTSTAGHLIYGRELELVFLIDGERVRRVPAATGDDFSHATTEKNVKQTVITGMTTETLRRITRAKTVEMKLGETEVKLSPEVLDAVRSFAACALSGK
jgi:hypothetical protein